MSALTYRQIWDDQTAWTFATFGPPGGPDDVRGRLEHLLEEIDEVAADPTNAEEYADCVLLVWDAARRDGHDLGTIEPYHRSFTHPSFNLLRLTVEVCVEEGATGPADYGRDLWGAISSLAHLHGISGDQLLQAMHDKLQVCKQRTWETKVPGQPCRHVKEVPGE